MTISSRPAAARTDVAATTTGQTLPAAPAAPAISSSTIRRVGAGLATGTVLWASTMVIWGGTAQGFGGRMGDLAGLAFQLGLFGLLQVQLRTRATGTSRKAVAMIKVEHVLLALASLWSLLHAITPDTGWLVALDVFWPLSMLGMGIIGIKIAVAGRWSGALRVWPMVAESWVFVAVPAYAITGGSIVGSCIGAGHLLLGYTMLGVLLARRPELTAR
jgi:hypothetical protein